jgi:signal transduction histidine kinase/ActR/RegA family two-component response regulator
MDEDMRLLSNLATSAATSIENGRLYQVARQEIAERKRAEEKLSHERALLATRVSNQTAELRNTNEELAHAARMKDEFLASMSHELRTPLNAILGISEGLQEQIYGPMDERQTKALSMVEQSGRHLLDLINDILDVAKFEAGEMMPDFRWISVSEICEASFQFIRQSASKKHIKIISHIDDRVDYIRADSRRLKQILINLLTNAVKFSHQEGSIGLDVKGDPENKIVRFTVWDNGIGIAPENMARLFKPFVQLDSRLSREYSGTGLGLTLVKRLAELHDGSVNVHSEVGKGTRFIVTLPWQRTDPLAKEISAMADRRKQIIIDTGILGKTPARGPLILLAEDDEINSEIFAHAIETMGFQVQVVRDGSEAVAFSRSDFPSLILMDIQMPGMDGLEAIRRIRAHSETASIPIVALTALAMAGDRELCLEAGADDYLSKPVPLKTLKKAIRKQLNGIEQARVDS